MEPFTPSEIGNNPRKLPYGTHNDPAIKAPYL